MKLIPPIKTLILKQVPSLLACTVLFSIVCTKCFGQTPTIEMYAGAGNPTGNGPTTSAQLITLQHNTNNPTGNTIGAYSPAITVSYALSNQQFAGIEANPAIAGSQFGGSTKIGGDGNNAPVPGQATFALMNAVSGSPNTNYTACNPCGAGTGIDVPLTNR